MQTHRLQRQASPGSYHRFSFSDHVTRAWIRPSNRQTNEPTKQRSNPDTGHHDPRRFDHQGLMLALTGEASWDDLPISPATTNRDSHKPWRPRLLGHGYIPEQTRELTNKSTTHQTRV
ncbi:hypothetical protein LOK49_LG07G01275 [Camellia lanceoleosa]|uniref:Uncharacterized protein n=1 Tax=Camellia lanceoleosa TaxID=1840588 RepID=A0ACC0H040_9ERIC|nr:hypothetical protein LOK49_LG07G01275 [Camellia lanceoleosa]